MLFTSLNQGALFLIFASAGFVAFIGLLPLYILCHKLKNKWCPPLIFLLTITHGAFLWCLILWLNYGELRFYLFCAYFVGFYLGKTIFDKIHRPRQKNAILFARSKK